MSEKVLDEMTEIKMKKKILKDMTQQEIDQFLACARVGRIGISLEDGPYIVPLGYGYEKGKVFFHTCFKGLKMEGIKQNPYVCFEVDESLSDASMFKSVIISGTAEIIDDKTTMIPYLQKLIDKYRIPMSFDDYMSKPGRDVDKEMEIIRVCLITPKKITGRMMVRIDRNNLK